MYFGQVITAMVTPFDENGNVDYLTTRTLIQYLLANGSDALVVAGTTGESPTLTTQEKVELFQFVVQEVNGRVPVIAGTGSNNTYASIELTQLAEQAGVDAAMLVTPYYNKPSQEGLYQHFRTIADRTELPLILYNVPGRTVTSLAPDTVVNLSEVDNIVAVKEASGDMDAISHIIHETDSQFSLYSGDDSLTLPIMSVGGCGVISVASHLLGNEMQAMLNQFRSGNVQNAAALHRKLVPMMNAFFAAPSPTPIKAALEMNGVLPNAHVRLPLVPLDAEQRQELYRIIYPKIIDAVS